MNGSVTVQELVDREYVGVSESDEVRETVELMLEEGAESAVVLRGEEPVGVMTERDVLDLVVEEGVAGATVSDAMTTDVESVTADYTLTEAADVMSTQAVKRILVTDGEQALGVLTEHDLLATAPLGHSQQPDAEADTARMAMAGVGERIDREAPADVVADYEDQSICEACGSFARELSRFNGQLLCGDCRDI